MQPKWEKDIAGTNIFFSFFMLFHFEMFRSIPPNPTKSLEYYKKACDEGNLGEACHRYSAYFIKGMKNICEKNMEEAFKYSLKGMVRSGVRALS